MKHLLCLFLLVFGMNVYAQTANDSICYRYIIAEPQGRLFSDKRKGEERWKYHFQLLRSCAYVSHISRMGTGIKL